MSLGVVEIDSQAGLNDTRPITNSFGSDLSIRSLDHSLEEHLAGMEPYALMSPPYWLIVPLFLLFLYVYGRYPYYVWSRLGVHGPAPTIFLGNNPDLFKPEGAYTAIRKWEKKYGRVFGIYVFRRPMLVVMEPELLREVLVKDFNNFNERYFFSGGFFNNQEVKSGLFFASGAQWKRIRTIMTPAFSSNKLKLITEHVQTCAQRLGTVFRQAAENGDLVDVKKVFGAYSMDVIASTAFSLQVDTQSDLEEPLIRHGISLFTPSPYLKTAVLLVGSIPHLFRPILGKLGVRFFKQQDMNYFTELIRHMIQTRKEEDFLRGKKRVDILQLLIDAEAEDGEMEEGMAKKLSSEEIIAQCLVFFIAGYETTSTTLQFILYELSRNHDVQSRLVKEIDDVIGDLEPTYESCQGLKFMDAVIKETLRMYPPLSQISRRVEKTTKLGQTVVPANSGILIPIYNIGRSSAFYKNPEKFDPERFLEGGSFGQRGWVLDPLTFLPFGFGPRLCLGMRFAMLEVRFALVHVLRKVCVTSSVPAEIGLNDFTVLLKPSELVRVEVKPRD